MIKKTADNKWYVVGQPHTTFATEGEARTHEAVVRRAGNVNRPDSRPIPQRIADNDFQVPMAEQPGRFDSLKASLQAHDAGYKPSWTREQRILHSIRLTEARQQGEDDAAAAEQEWFAQPAVQVGLAEAKRLLAAAEDDPTIDQRDVVLATQVITSFQTVGADLTAVNAMLRNLRGFEADRNTARQIAANDQLNVALAKVQALADVTPQSIKVPVSGESLGERGNSYIANLMSGNAPFGQVDAAFEAVNAFHAGNPEPLKAALAVNEPPGAVA
jgi:hypothetical protein